LQCSRLLSQEYQKNQLGRGRKWKRRETLVQTQTRNRGRPELDRSRREDSGRAIAGEEGLIERGECAVAGDGVSGDSRGPSVEDIAEGEPGEQRRPPRRIRAPRRASAAAATLPRQTQRSDRHLAGRAPAVSSTWTTRSSRHLAVRYGRSSPPPSFLRSDER